MSLAEIKSEAAKLSREEREDLSAHLVMLEHLNDPGWGPEMSQRVKEGDFVTREELLGIHERLSGEGR